MNYGDLDRLWNESRREIFRLETLPVYTVPEEEKALAAFLRGESLPVRTPETSSWIGRLAETSAKGVRLYRVHIVDLPLTDYLRYELASYPDSTAVGMETYIAERAGHPDLAGLDEDYWMFDEQHVVVMTYDPEGRPLGPVPGKDVERYVAWRDVAMAHAVPLDAWMRKNGDRLSA
jgi:hypothetical protein